MHTKKAGFSVDNSIPARYIVYIEYAQQIHKGGRTPIGINIIISNASSQPIYEQILSQLRAAILNGALSPGEALPSIRALASSLSVSVITTKRAYEELEREGLIDTAAGRGSFVSQLDERQRQLGREDQLRIPLKNLVAQARSLSISDGTLRRLLEQALRDE